MNNLKARDLQRENKKSLGVNLWKGRLRLGVIMVSIMEEAEAPGMQGAL